MAGAMKIRHPWLIKALGFAGAWMVRLWITTLRYRHYAIGSSALPDHPQLRSRYIYAFWHENMLLPAYHCARPDVSVLISQHADGELIATVCQELGFRVIRGSSTRGGTEALRQMLRAARRGAHLALTPDGPRGPRRQVQAGVIYLAAKTGLPIIASGIGFQNPWRLRSWDRFVLPRPWCRATLVTADPIAIPADLDTEGLEHYRQLVEEALRKVSETAERWAENGGRLPELNGVELIRGS
jgi:lysophospholipid acyltransferase (LPLAT)-like uncharacterized protein